MKDTIEEINITNYKKDIKSKNVIIRILIIIIIILLILLCILCLKLGKIGYAITTQTEDIDKGVSVIEIQDDNTKWKEIQNDLDIFSNYRFNYENIIAPNSSGVYEFAVKNLSDEDVEYKIQFKEDSKYNINMKYKLKLENVYIVGNEEEWVGVEELTKDKVKVASNSINLYTLEWKWIHSDKEDTYVGMQEEAKYLLHLNIVANVLTENNELKENV